MIFWEKVERTSLLVSVRREKISLFSQIRASTATISFFPPTELYQLCVDVGLTIDRQIDQFNPILIHTYPIRTLTFTKPL